MTQAERVLKQAKTFRGVSQLDFNAHPTVDNGPLISRVAARIQDLKDAGHTFQALPDRAGFKVYRLVGVDEASSTSSSSDGPSERLPECSSAAGPMSTDTLFGVPRRKAAMSPYDPMSDAA